jgi:hypothetical protein
MTSVVDRRRFLVTSLASVIAAPLAVRAQQARKPPRLCFITLDPRPTHGRFGPLFQRLITSPHATGAAIFLSAHLGKGSEVRINGVVHLKTHLAAGATVPIAWVAVGNPAQVLPPSAHERISEIQKALNFPLTVYGFERSDATMEKITRRLSEALGSHASDEMMRAEELE